MFFIQNISIFSQVIRPGVRTSNSSNIFYYLFISLIQQQPKIMIGKVRERNSRALKTGPSELTLCKPCLRKQKFGTLQMAHELSPLPPPKPEKKRKTIQLPLKSLSKGSARIFTSTLLQKRTLRGLEKYSAASAHQLGKEWFTQY